MNGNDFTFVLDGENIRFEPGQTIMEAATQAGIYIPHLCYHADYRPRGSCKLCTVKINGRFGSACTMPVQPGMQIDNDTDELTAMRRRLVQMLFVEGNHYCPHCEKSGNCQLQAVAYHVGMTDSHYPHFYPLRQLDASHPDMLLDRDRCIACELCVRASLESDGKAVFGLAGRGSRTRVVVNSESGLLGDSDFSADDVAARICPTGALIPKREAYLRPIGARQYDLRDIAHNAPPDPPSPEQMP
ncbi:2Fe-2S iron-sulfur cluster-binding protein [Chitinilyticum piscinae]|uniref:(2Fe-2S)-binding protein n=1 Tax=Chitinilyticum piscinae TaxID=2866724 RepID=A0A8J7K7Y9_9NEIS|nr:2Fe-2S iron-sulfur cluster-binding protein [Chitinilyticum piscinae]MBE9608773.1 (2Fe-2S)-binding protein [Chitinilyticum piscinae]